MCRIWMNVVFPVIYLRTRENGDEIGYMMGYGIIRYNNNMIYVVGSPVFRYTQGVARVAHGI